MKTRLKLVIVLLLVGTGFAMMGKVIPNFVVPDAPANVCAEDDPCWDCKTMGNLICGTPTVVELEAAYNVFGGVQGQHHGRHYSVERATRCR